MVMVKPLRGLRPRADMASRVASPPYDVLDAILEQVVEGERGPSCVAPPPGASEKAVRDVIARLYRNEYKRRQAPLVLRTSPKAFGSGRRLPIVHRYWEN